MGFLSNLMECLAGSGSGQVRYEDVRGRIEKVEGLLVPKQEEWLFESAKALPDGARIVEIGSFKGRSTVSIGYGCLGSRKHLFCIDKFQGLYEDLDRNDELKKTFARGFFGEWRQNVETNGLLEYVTPLVGDSHEIARIWNSQINMLFIDGSHLFDDVMADFANFFPHVAPGGLIGLHDVVENWDGPFRAWNDHIRQQLERTGAVSTLAYGYKPAAA